MCRKCNLIEFSRTDRFLVVRTATRCHLLQSLFESLEPGRMLSNIDKVRNAVNGSLMKMVFDTLCVRFCRLFFNSSDPEEFENCRMPLLNRSRQALSLACQDEALVTLIHDESHRTIVFSRWNANVFLPCLCYRCGYGSDCIHGHSSTFDPLRASHFVRHQRYSCPSREVHVPSGQAASQRFSVFRVSLPTLVPRT